MCFGVGSFIILLKRPPKMFEFTFWPFYLPFCLTKKKKINHLTYCHYSYWRPSRHWADLYKYCELIIVIVYLHKLYIYLCTHCLWSLVKMISVTSQSALSFRHVDSLEASFSFYLWRTFYTFFFTSVKTQENYFLTTESI